MKVILSLVAVSTLLVCAAATNASREVVVPQSEATQLVAASAPLAASGSEEHAGRAWPMLGLSALIAAGGLVLFRRIASTIS